MATFKKFEDIEAWQLAREISKDIFMFTEREKFYKDFRLRDQARGSVGSMMDNIAEGMGRGGNYEFILFLSYGLGSGNELKSQCYRAMDYNYITQEEFQTSYEKMNRYSKMVAGLISYLNKTDIKGEKFKNRKSNPTTENHKP